MRHETWAFGLVCCGNVLDVRTENSSLRTEELERVRVCVDVC